MSRLNNEGVRKAAGGILANLTEAEHLSIKKRVLTDKQGTVETRILEESVEEKEEVKDEKLNESVEPTQPEGAEDPVPGEGKEPLQEDEIEGEELPVEEPAAEDPNEKLAKATELLAKVFGVEVSEEEREAARAELTDLVAGEAEATEELPVEEPVEGEEIVEESAKICEKCGKEPCECEKDKAEEKMVEGLEIVDVANNKFLLKESAGYIVGKNYNKATGLIEEAETYKTEKIARKAFDRLK
ncbi:MAG: hypothetical protein IJF92_00845 [Bacilli bacterium]|nr:hypothetical protein [Bacilli bacterium]MBQ3307639.1 hypothetical protein [Bacilli bacterium]